MGAACGSIVPCNGSDVCQCESSDYTTQGPCRSDAVASEEHDRQVNGLNCCKFGRVAQKSSDSAAQSGTEPMDRTEANGTFPVTKLIDDYDMDTASTPMDIIVPLSHTLEGKYNMKLIDFDSGGQIFNINLHEHPEGKQNLERYYQLCRDHMGLSVTTSCFTVWKDSKKSNGLGKVIPAVRDDNKVCVFFFDDNLEFEGKENSSGICNLRDVATGEFVDFCEGQNGFVSTTSSKHTIVYYSTEYRIILVKANILDAMEDEEYFSTIVKDYARPDERIIVYMDVNSTIVSTDSVQGKGLEEGLLSVMFELIEFKPKEAFNLDWGALPQLRIEQKPKPLKSYVKEMTGKDAKAYTAFWQADNCMKFVNELSTMGDMKWVTQQETSVITLEDFNTIFNEYLVSLEKTPTVNGIARSWFKVFENIKTEHSVVLNSFGVDTLKVVKSTVASDTSVLQVAVNYEKWDDRDVKKYQAQFTE